MKSFWQKMDFRFVISREMGEGRGEDSFYSAQLPDSAVSAVFDGCGGLGSRMYPDYSRRTGAYMAARAASGALHDWYHASAGGRDGQSGPALAGRITEYLDGALRVVHDHAGDPGRIFGTMVRDFPTTAAIALARSAGEEIEVDCFWAGDSRIYLLDRQGLAQLTRDDVYGNDAMTNLRSDGALSNVISSDRKYELHAGRPLRIREEEPCIIFAATDGCFGYLPSPMDFEDVLLHCLLQARAPEDFRQRLDTSIRAVAGDDFTLALMSFGFGDFESMQKELADRERVLQQRFMDRLGPDPSLELQQEVWEDYRPDYERLLPAAPDRKAAPSAPV